MATTTDVLRRTTALVTAARADDWQTYFDIERALFDDLAVITETRALARLSGEARDLYREARALAARRLSA